jgi:hypothetical protein
MKSRLVELAGRLRTMRVVRQPRCAVLGFEPGDGWNPSKSAHRQGVVTSYSFAAAPAPSRGTTGITMTGPVSSEG